MALRGLDMMIRSLALVGFAFALAGCGPGGVWLGALVMVVALALAGCSESREAARDGGPGQDARIVGGDASVDAGHADASDLDAGGRWETCCEDGRISTCFCPASHSCNYGLGLIVCDDGVRCGYGPGGDDDRERLCGAGLDAGVGRDAGGEPGEWEPCCLDGRVDLCFCPAGAVCNYGLYEDCGEGYCASPPGSGCPG